jgi:hypothetical protein
LFERDHQSDAGSVQKAAGAAGGTGVSGRLERQWQSFKGSCFPPNLSKQQNIDLKRTFFGGAAGLINAMTEIPVESMSTDELFSEVQAELLMFNEDVKAGRA